MSEFTDHLKGRFQRRFVVMGVLAVVGVVKGMFGAADANAEKGTIGTWQKAVSRVVFEHVTKHQPWFDTNKDKFLDQYEMGSLEHSIPQDCSPGKEYLITDSLFVQPISKIANLECVVKLFKYANGNVSEIIVEVKDSKGETQTLKSAVQ